MLRQIDEVRKIPYHSGIVTRRTAMPEIHEVATLTSKGQITLPKPIRQALGVDAGGKVAFDLRGGEVIVTRADAEHEDPAIEALTEGATDYVLKQKLSRLAPAVMRALNEAENQKERKRMEEVLRESEERFRTLAEKSPVGVYILQDDLFRYVNPAFAEIHGYEVEEVIDRLGSSETLLSEEKELVRERILRRLDGEIIPEGLQFHIRRKDGTIRTVEGFASVAVHQGRPALLGSLIDITERKKSEERLFQATRRWERTFDAVPDLIAVLDKDFRIVQANKAMAERLSVTSEECVGRFCYRMVHGTDAPPALCPHARSIADGREHMVEVSETRLGGDFIVSTSPMFDSDGTMIGSVHVARDITQRKKAETALRKSQLQLTEAMDLANIVYWEMDPVSRTFIFNDPFYAFFGTTAESEGGYHLPVDEYPERFMHPEEAELFPRLLERYRVGEEPEVSLDLEHRIIRRDGVVRHALVRARILRDKAGSILRVHGALQDITERKHAAEELDRISKRNSLLLESAGEGIYGMDAEGKITFINPAAAKTLGYDPLEIIGEPAHDLIHSRKPDGAPYPEKDCPICATYSPGAANHVGKDHFRRKDGGSFPVEYTGRRVIEKDKHVGAVVTFRDITEREEMARRLQQAQKMEAIGTLAGGIAHDFNNILTPIIAHTEMALADIPRKSRLRFSLEEVLKAADRARELVQQILAFSRQTEGKQVVLDVAPVVKEVLKLLRASLPSTIEIRKEIEPAPWSVLADPTQIHQILMNLCTNAAHAMRDKGGVLEIRLINQSLDSETASAIHGLKPGCYLRLSVSDSGHGMKPEVIEHIFEPYFTTKGKGEGTGLGLAVVHGIVSTLGGAVAVMSEPGKGSVFHVFLPMVERRAPARIQETASLPMGSENVLLVDDEKPMVDALRLMLERLGYKVTARESGVDALEVFRLDPSRFDLLLTDQTMPVLTGVDLAMEILRIRPSFPILLTTGFSDLVNEEKARSIGIREFITKPILMKELAAALRRALDGR